LAHNITSAPTLSLSLSLSLPLSFSLPCSVSLSLFCVETHSLSLSFSFVGTLFLSLSLVKFLTLLPSPFFSIFNFKSLPLSLALFFLHLLSLYLNLFPSHSFNIFQPLLYYTLYLSLSLYVSLCPSFSALFPLFPLPNPSLSLPSLLTVTFVYFNYNFYCRIFNTLFLYFLSHLTYTLSLYIFFPHFNSITPLSSSLFLSPPLFPSLHLSPSLPLSPLSPSLFLPLPPSYLKYFYIYLLFIIVFTRSHISDNFHIDIF